MSSIMRQYFRAALPLLVVASAACSESEANPTGPNGQIPEPAINQIVTYGPLNASSSDTLVYFSFATGGLVARSADWDLAFRRYELRLNSPAIAGSGSKNVLGFPLDNNKAASDAQVLAFTPAATLDAFNLVRDAQIPPDDQFQTDRLTENRQGFLNLSGVPSANAAAYWKVRLANGSFALLRATAIAFTPQFQVQSLTLESRVQSGSTLGAPQTLTLTPAGQTTAVSLVTNGVVASPSGCNWDFQFNPAANQLAITVNTVCGVGSYPGASSPTFANATAASDAPQYAAYLAQLVGPIPNSVTDKSAPFRYNLTGNDRLHASFNTYLVRSGVKTYKVQVTDYYSNTGVAGFPTIRYARIR
ncbi:MAG: HmuY family protein [Gemmatimonadaceae bacterium]|nr:HmuY family protein [Gemmatimonadaceae bacterium]